jgi:hypothetical protein
MFTFLLLSEWTIEVATAGLVFLVYFLGFMFGFGSDKYEEERGILVRYSSL